MAGCGRSRSDPGFQMSNGLILFWKRSPEPLRANRQKSLPSQRYTTADGTRLIHIMESHMEPRLLEIVLCPLWQGKLILPRAEQRLICRAARRASTRLPDKPLLDSAGAPMMVRTAQRASQSKAQRIIVATDDPSIEQTVNKHGFEAILTRPDHATGTDRLAEVAERLA